MKKKEINFENMTDLEYKSTATPGLKFNLLKKIMLKLPIPKVKTPKLENLQYDQARWLYKYMTVVDYIWKVVDDRAVQIAGHDPKVLEKKRELFKNILSAAIILIESDSYYRTRFNYMFQFMKSDTMLIHYYAAITKLGLDEKWDGEVLRINFRRTGPKGESFGDIFKDIPTKPIPEAELKKRLGRKK